MNILIVTGSYAPEIGGIASFVRGFASGLVENGARIHILSATTGSSEFSTPSLPISEFHLPKTGYLRRISACRHAVLQLAGQMQFDRMVASSWSPYAVIVPLWVKRRQLPLDILCHGMDLLEPNRSLVYRFLMRRTLCRAQLISANSEFTATIARSVGAPAERVSVMHPGIEPDRFMPGSRNPSIRDRHGIPDQTRIILSVGRLVERKGFDIMLGALPKILDRYPRTAYLIVGVGPDRERLERLASSLNVRERVRFAGRVSEEDLPGYYQASDVFVMPSRELPAEGDVEGFGIVFLEAALCAVPAVGGNSGGTADAILDGRTGYLVDPQDPNELCDKLLSLFSDEELRLRLGRAGRERAATEFCWPQIARCYLEKVARTAVYRTNKH